MQKRKVRIMIITGGGSRQQSMEKLFEAILRAHPDDVDPPVYAAAVPARSLRSRFSLLRTANEARLLPDKEWEAIERIHGSHASGESGESSYLGDGRAMEASTESALTSSSDPKLFFDCLREVPVEEGRRGSPQDVELHYSEELWRKAKALNRGRAVLGCTLAHLIALPRFVDGEFDMMLEDNVRAPVEEFVERFQNIVKSSREWSSTTGHPCHLRYYGWLGSIPNLRWIYDTHIPSRGHPCEEITRDGRVFPFPTPQDIQNDLAKSKARQNDLSSMNGVSGGTLTEDGARLCSKTESLQSERDPGGNAIWGSYGYHLSREGYQMLLRALRNDVGALLHKSKRARFYTVKPIDKILPRIILRESPENPLAVHLCSRPVVFRAPMLTSKIHVRYDPEFCRSTEVQLQKSGLDWAALWLTQAERETVHHREQSGEWIASKTGEEDGRDDKY
jgi:GR25 family glycosyltransferase involved in LPS biosynthesis